MNVMKRRSPTKKPRGGRAVRQASGTGRTVATKAPSVRTKKKRPVDSTSAFEEALRSGTGPAYVLKLFVAGTTPRSVRAIENIKKICEDRLRGRYKLQVIDIYQQPELAVREQLVVAPTLVKQLPLPLRTFIGDLSETDRVLVGLNLEPKPV